MTEGHQNIANIVELILDIIGRNEVSTIFGIIATTLNNEKQFQGWLY